jgi:hypothetical protein
MEKIQVVQTKGITFLQGEIIAKNENTLKNFKNFLKNQRA